jgi:hypothetical protein
MSIKGTNKNSFWKEVETVEGPTGLYHYGMGITSSGFVVIYGGVSDDGADQGRVKKNLVSYSDFWYLNLQDDIQSFRRVNNNIEVGAGGYSKIVTLVDDVICILNRNMQNRMTVIDMKTMSYYYLIDESDYPEPLHRTAFGMVLVNNIIVIIGGYDEENSQAKEIQSSPLYAIKLEKSLELELGINKLYFLGALGIIPLVMVAVLISKKFKCSWCCSGNAHSPVSASDEDISQAV